MKEIICKKGEITKVDDIDYPLLSQFKWKVNNERGYKYVICGKAKLHRVIMGTSFHPKKFIDHIDGDGLNNQRENLRICTNAENILNQKLRKNNTTGYKGVVKNIRGKFEVRCTIKGNTKYGGSFKNARDAAKRYNELSRILHGEFSKPNYI